MTEYTVNIKVLNGENLLYQKEPANKCNPFVRFHIYGSNSYYRSETIYENANPVWNEDIEVPVNDPTKSQLSIEILSQGLADDFFLADPFVVDINQLPMDSKLVAQLDLPLSLRNEPVGILNLEAYVQSAPKTEKPEFTGPVNIKIYIVEVSAITRMQNDDDGKDSFVTFQIEGQDPNDQIKFDLSSASDSMLDQTYSITSKDPSNDAIIINMKSGGEDLIKNLSLKVSEMCPGSVFEQDLRFSNKKGSTLTKGGHLKIRLEITNVQA